MPRCERLVYKRGDDIVQWEPGNGWYTSESFLAFPSEVRGMLAVENLEHLKHERLNGWMPNELLISDHDQ